MLLLNSLRGMIRQATARRDVSRRLPRRGRPNRRLVLEELEGRTLLSSYSFTPIADTGPGSPYSGLGVGQAINDLGAVAFQANLRSGGEALLTRNVNGSLGIIATTSDLIRTFALSPYMNDSGTVSFGADLRDGSRAIFTGSGLELTRIARHRADQPLQQPAVAGPAHPPERDRLLSRQPELWR